MSYTTQPTAPAKASSSWQSDAWRAAWTTQPARPTNQRLTSPPRWSRRSSLSCSSNASPSSSPPMKPMRSSHTSPSMAWCTLSSAKTQTCSSMGARACSSSSMARRASARRLSSPTCSTTTAPASVAGITRSLYSSAFSWAVTFSSPPRALATKRHTSLCSVCAASPR